MNFSFGLKKKPIQAQTNTVKVIIYAWGKFTLCGTLKTA